MFIKRNLAGRMLATAAIAGLSMVGFSAAVAGETITYFHNDILGSPIVATDSNGLVAWKEHYRPYGDRIVDAPESTNNALWYTGKPHDEETGLTYLGARYYDPVAGRFMGIDPAPIVLHNIHSLNRYTYANNNPYKYTDPTGSMPKCHGALVGQQVVPQHWYPSAHPYTSQRRRGRSNWRH